MRRKPTADFIKTHTPLDGIPYFDNVTYLFVARDPRDAFISMGNHQQKHEPRGDAAFHESAAGARCGDAAPVRRCAARFRNWISASGIPEEGVPTEFNVLHHAQTFWEFRHLPNIHLFHYSDMRADLAGQMRRVADAAGITVDAALWPKLVEAASFERMKENADALAPTSTHQNPGATMRLFLTRANMANGRAFWARKKWRCTAG